MLHRFQSTPPAEARGDIHPLVKHGRSYVSIHSPRRSEGRPWRHFFAVFWWMFQSTPPPKRGETCEGRRRGGQAEVSIHSPRRSEGRRQRSRHSGTP